MLACMHATQLLLLLEGDVETNPGPVNAAVMKQLQKISGDLKEIIENCLASIDAKLQDPAGLDEKLSYM